MIQGTVHRDFKATYNLLAFDQALEKQKTCRTKNQYPYEWPSKTVDQTSAKIIIGSKCQLKTTRKEHQKIKIRSHDKQEIFSTIHKQPYSNFCLKTEETMLLASGIHKAKIRIITPHHKIISRYRPEKLRGI